MRSARFGLIALALLAGTRCSEPQAEPQATGGSGALGASGGQAGSAAGSGGASGAGAASGMAGKSGAAGAGGGDASLDPLSGLAACEGTPSALLLALKSTLAKSGSGDYLPPAAAARDALAASINELSAANAGSAQAQASSAGYSLCRAGAVALWRPLQPSAGGAAIAWRSSGAREVILEAPHPLHDSKTFEQAIGLFDALSARALVTSGTHRCASSAASPCSGTTEACSAGTPQAFRVSDMAHVENSFFHRAHQTLSALHSSDLIIGLHGMKDGGASISDGTKLPTSAGSPVARSAAELAKAFVGSPLSAEPITTCNPYPGAPAVADRLCGTTDVQGRHTNGSANPCTQAASASSGRFLHLEQSPALRDRPDLVAIALQAVVAPPP
jgi:hypothetical protein